MPPDAACTITLNNREKIESYAPSTSQPPNPIPHSILGFLQVLFSWGNNIHAHHCHTYLSLPQPPYPHLLLKNGVLLPYRFCKPIYFHNLRMYLTVNLPHHIANFGGVLLLTASQMISQILKCTSSPPQLLMRLHGPEICSLLLCWQPLVP